MYTSYIGTYFIELYNKKKNTNYDAEHFFEEKMFPLFFDEDMHLMHVGNSPFFQKPKAEDVKKHGSKSLVQFHNLKEKMKTDSPNMSIFVGYGASDAKGTTSGQMSDLPNLDIDIQEMYASWIGQALAIGVSGGNVFLLKNEDVLWKLYEGWKYYRKYLNQTPNIKDKQIETWNGNWLAHILSKSYISEQPFVGYNMNPEKVQGKLAIPTISWSYLFYKLSAYFGGEELLINAYSLSQTNTTLGFIKVFLHEVQRPIAFKHKLFDFKEYKSEISIEDIEKFETFYTFSNACQMGTIGLKALEPKGLRAYMPKGTMPFAQGKELNFKKQESFYLYEIYQIWIMTTLNKTQLLELASKMAKILVDVEALGERGKKTMATLSKNTRESKSLVQFAENLSHIVELTTEKELVRKVLKEVLVMPTDNYPLFITLVRFEYNYLTS